MNNFNMKHIFRLIRKNKIYSLVNIFGLSIGLASAVIIYLFIEFELSFDDFYSNTDQVYRVTRTIEHASGIDRDGATFYPMGYSLRNDFPDFNFSTIYMMESQDILISNNVYNEKNIMFVDSAFFNLLDVNWIIGSPDLIHQHPGNIAITKSLSEKFFGIQNSIGKTITFSPNKEFKIAGLLEDPPLNATHQYSIILSTENLNAEMIGYEYDSWSNTISGFECYAKIPDVVDKADLASRMNKIIKDKYIVSQQDKDRNSFSFQAFKEMHLSPDLQNMPNTYSTSKSTLWIFAFIALLIITIAGINFINLSTAQGFKRAKEVGVRKVLGASKSQLSYLFIKENLLLSFVALVMAVIFVEIALPYINIFLGNNHDLSIYNSAYFVLFFLIIYVIINVIIALYPSFVMSKFSPVKTLKGNFKAPKQQLFGLRNSLLIFQFTISIALIIATIVIKKQVVYIDSKDLGFKVDQIMQFSLPESDSAKIQSMSQFLKTEPGVASFGFGIAAPSSSSNFTTSFNVEGEDRSIQRYLNFKPVDVGYQEVFKIDLLAGAWLKERRRGDSIFKLVINEKLCKIHGFKSPEEAINKKIPFGRNGSIIVGVVKDFHTYSLHSEIDPLAFVYMPRFYSGMFVKIEPNRLKETTTRIENKLSELFPTYFIEYQSVKDGLQEMYVEEDRTATIITVMSSLAIIIASLGLFGLVSFMMVQKVKEIGIRKVLGASLRQIITTLTQTYLKLILVASLIAIPLGWYFMNIWLDAFSYRINIAFWIYILAIIITLMIALLVILFQVVKTGRMNSVEALKYD
jgi:putative ABC transport system permease protein